VDEGGFSCAHFTGDHSDRSPCDDAEFQHRECTAMRARPEQKVRVGQQGKRSLGKTEVIQVKIVARHSLTITRAKAGIIKLVTTEPSNEATKWLTRGISAILGGNASLHRIKTRFRVKTALLTNTIREQYMHDLCNR